MRFSCAPVICAVRREPTGSILDALPGRLVLAVVASSMFAAWFGLFPHPVAAQPPGMRGPAPVEVSPVIQRRQASSQTFVGTLNPIRRSLVGSAVEGRVIAVHVEPGDAVDVEQLQDADPAVLGDALVSPEHPSPEHPSAMGGSQTAFRGQVLVELLTDTLEIEIQAAQVELELRQQELEELQQSLPEEIAFAEAAVAESRARLEFARSNYQRMTQLTDVRGGISEREVEEARSQFNAQQQALAGAESTLNRLRATREVRQAIARSRVASQQAQLDRLYDQLDNHSIRAPFPGYVTRKLVEIGDWVNRGGAVVEVIQPEPMELVISIPQRYLMTLHQSLEQLPADGRLEVDVRVESLGTLIPGYVASVIPQVDERARTIPVRILLENPRGPRGYLLSPGLLAHASLMLGPDQDVLMVHKDALVLSPDSTRVWVVAPGPPGDGPVARPVDVTVGAGLDNYIEVRGLLDAGDLVVTRGNERLRPGQPIQVVQ